MSENGDDGSGFDGNSFSEEGMRKIAEVIDLKPKHTSELRFEMKRGDNICRHMSMLVDENKRTVECGRCGTVLDAFDALNSLAKDHVHIFREYDWRKNEIKLFLKRIEVLKRLEENARARARKLGLTSAKYQLDNLLNYVRRRDKKPDIDTKSLRDAIEYASHEARIGAGLEAIQAGHVLAGVELIRPAIDELEAGVFAEETIENRSNG